MKRPKKIVYKKNNVAELLAYLMALRIKETSFHDSNDFHKIITFNGCFDIPTPGHMRLLNQVRILKSEPEFIVVCGLNSDASVEKIKGTGRPILNEKERARFLIETGIVDFIYIYDEEDSGEFIKLFMPHQHVNDSIYGNKSVEHEAVKTYEDFFETEIIMTNHISGEDVYSTSDIVNRIKNANSKSRKEQTN